MVWHLRLLLVAALIAFLGIPVCHAVNAGYVGRMGPASGSGRAVSMQLAGADSLPSYVTFTRASSRTCWNGSGAVVALGNDVPCLDIDPVSLAPRGLLIERSRTDNSAYGNFTGGTPGTIGSGGSLPMGVAIFGGSGYSVDFVGTGTERGLPYMDLRFYGASPTNSSIYVTFTAASSIAASNGQTWTGSVYQRYVSGSLANISSARVRLQDYTAVVGGAATDMVFTLTDTYARYAHTRTTTTAGMDNIRMFSGILPSGAGAVDITVRYYGPQLEQGAFASSEIATTGTAATRAADVANISDITTIGYNQSEGTFVIEFEFLGLASGVEQKIIEVSVGINGQNRMVLDRQGNGILAWIVLNGNATQANIPLASPPVVGAVYKTAVAYKLNDFAACLNGGAVGTDTSGLLPSGTVDRMGIGKSGNTSSGETMDGWIRRITYYPVRLDNATLQQLTQ